MQFVITTRGRAFGVVLDSSPMTDRQARVHRCHFGARCMADVLAHARFVAGCHPFTVTRLVHRPVRVSRPTRSPNRRYAAESFARIVTFPSTPERIAA